ncbi:response regulator [Bacillus sp. NEB1478]|uniref:response regulator transcription factor n=1 Tax=Bacillus sp. NEB1478 TaxID=3073816 RepID=UPI002872CEF6|nr:response regulator [Bacillus sp. NEB1478]WNB92365.1 response regulator [Bacillus sp. NEB1478]
MYKVMIVDDEPVIRNGLKASIPWDREPFELTGAFANGKEALAYFEEQRPDILITDIKMPIMDGIELAREALQIHPSLKIIFVSSYSDFDYVREGLKIGAVDYLLKPTLEPEDLVNLLKKCTHLIEQEQKIQQNLDEYKQNQQGYHRKELEQKLKLLFTSKQYEYDEAEWNTSFPDGYTVCYGSLNNKKDLEEKKGDLYLSMKSEEAAETFYRHFDEGVMFSLYNADVVLTMPYSSEMKSQLHHIKNELENETEITLSMGYQSGECMNEFQTCFLQAKEACDYHFYHPDHDEIYHFENKFEINQEKNNFSILFKEAMNESDETRINMLQEQWLKDWEAGTRPPEDIKREAGELLSSRFQRKVDIPLLMQKVDELAQTESLAEMKELLFRTIVEWEEGYHISFDSLTSHQQLMEKAIHYIQQHYTSEITLQKIADYTFISKNYFSILFKKYMNQNFLDYVISLRIKKAEELLGNTSLKVYEVAYKSGFNDVKYFSKLFKKLTGYSPVDYREKAQMTTK